MNITIIGSTKGNGFTESAQKYAVEVGEEIAKRGHALLYGPELTIESLPSIAAGAAKQKGGTVIAIAIGRHNTHFYQQDIPTHIIYTDCSGGAGREVVLVNSANAVIAIGGGSGTLAEISMAYMNHVPIIAMLESGGWAEKLANQYVDERKKYTVYGASNAQEAVDAAEMLWNKFKTANNSQYV